MKMNATLIILFTLVTAISFSQCKYQTNEIDKFTKTSKIVTKSESLHKDFNSAISFSFCKFDSEYFVKVGINLTDKTYSIIDGDKLMLICGDSIVSLVSLETQVATGFVYVNYLITREQLEVLQNHTITNVRVYLRDSYIEKEIILKRANKIQLLSKCID